jgi:hypothetical protein
VVCFFYTTREVLGNRLWGRWGKPGWGVCGVAGVPAFKRVFAGAFRRALSREPLLSGVFKIPYLPPIRSRGVPARSNRCAAAKNRSQEGQQDEEKRLHRGERREIR